MSGSKLSRFINRIFGNKEPSNDYASTISKASMSLNSAVAEPETPQVDTFAEIMASLADPVSDNDPRVTDQSTQQFLSNIKEAANEFTNTYITEEQAAMLFKTFVDRMFNNYEFADTFKFVLDSYVPPPRMRRFIGDVPLNMLEPDGAVWQIIEIHNDGRQEVINSNGVRYKAKQPFSEAIIQLAVKENKYRELVEGEAAWELADISQIDFVKAKMQFGESFDAAKLREGEYAFPDPVKERVWALMSKLCVDPVSDEPLLTRSHIRSQAICNGFKLKPQADGADDLNAYVYDFAKALEATIRFTIWTKLKAGVLNAEPNASQSNDVPPQLVQ